MEKRLIVLTGIPGSGKSTYAQKILEHNKKAFIVSSDQIRLELLGKVDDFSQEELVFEKFENLIIEKSNDYEIIIADSAATTNTRRLLWAKKFAPHFKEIHLVYFKTSLRTALRRNKKRAHVVPFKDMIIMRKTFEKPSKEVLKNFDHFSVIR